jgi:transcription-repair coupling factor (superfamily II helicase)
MPSEVENLIQIARIKELGRKANVVKISQKKDGIVFLYDSQKFNVEIVDVLVKKYGSKVRFSPGTQPYVTLKIEKTSDKQILNDVKEYLVSNFVDEK